MKNKQRYPALHTVANLYEVFGYILGLAGVAICIYGFMNDQSLIGFGSLIGGMVLALTLKAVAEVLHVVMDIEENTRKSEVPDHLSVGSSVAPSLSKVTA